MKKETLEKPVIAVKVLQDPFLAPSDEGAGSRSETEGGIVYETAQKNLSPSAPVSALGQLPRRGSHRAFVYRGESLHPDCEERGDAAIRSLSGSSGRPSPTKCISRQK